MAAFTWFPIARGVFFRGGLGPAAIVKSTESRDDSSQASTETRTHGFGIMAGVGYAFWLGKRFNLLLSNDLHGAVLMGDESDEEPTEAWFNATQLGFMWY